MNIALLSAEFPPTPGGVGDYTRRLGAALVARGHRVSVVTIRDSELARFDIDESGGAGRALFSTRCGSWGWGMWRAVIAALDEPRPDVLHIQYQTGAFAMRPAINLLPWRLRRLPRRPAVVVTAHDLLPPYLFPKAGPLRGAVTRRLLDDADAAVLTNEEDYRRVARWRGGGASARGEALALIPIGSNIPVAPPAGYERAGWRARLGAGEGAVLVAYFGLISPSKGLHTLLDALERLPPSFRLLVIGGEATAPQDRAYAAALRERLDAPPLRGRVVTTGHCPEEEVSGHLLSADMAALPFTDGASFRRGSLLAALAHGVPVVTTGAAGRADGGERGVSDRPAELPRLVDGEQGLLVPPEDAGALAAALRRLAVDAGLRERIGAAGRELARRFSWESIAAQHERLYAALLER